MTTMNEALLQVEGMFDDERPKFEGRVQEQIDTFKGLGVDTSQLEGALATFRDKYEEADFAGKLNLYQQALRDGTNSLHGFQPRSDVERAQVETCISNTTEFGQVCAQIREMAGLPPMPIAQLVEDES
jgi:hypothetical protein